MYWILEKISLSSGFATNILTYWSEIEIEKKL